MGIHPAEEARTRDELDAPPIPSIRIGDWGGIRFSFGGTPVEVAQHEVAAAQLRVETATRNLARAQEDAAAQLATEQEPTAPEVAGIRVHLPATAEHYSRDYPAARTWTSVGGTLLVQAAETIAEYPPGAWVGVEDIYEETA